MFWFAAEIKPGSVAFLYEETKSAYLAEWRVCLCLRVFGVYWGARARSAVLRGITPRLPSHTLCLVFFLKFPTSTSQSDSVSLKRCSSSRYSLKVSPQHHQHHQSQRSTHNENEVQFNSECVVLSPATSSGERFQYSPNMATISQVDRERSCKAKNTLWAIEGISCRRQGLEVEEVRPVK